MLQNFAFVDLLLANSRKIIEKGLYQQSVTSTKPGTKSLRQVLNFTIVLSYTFLMVPYFGQ